MITILRDKKVLSPRLAEKISEMKGFRNILVHRYGQLNDEKAYSFLKEERGDFSLFEQEIVAYLRKLKV